MSKSWPIHVAITGVLLLMGMTGCGTAQDISHVSISPDAAGAANGFTWHDPKAADIGAIDELLQNEPSSTMPSFLGFRFAASSQLGVEAGSFYTGGTYRSFGRTYWPVSYGGNGWSSAGAQFEMIDSGAASMSVLAVGFLNPNVSLVTMGGTGPTLPQSAAFGVGSTWSYFTQGAATLAPTGYDPTNGYSTSVAGDGNGHGYFAYISSGGTAYLQDYTAFSGWDAGPGVTLGGGARQIEAHNDGIGTTVVWRGSPLFSSIASSSAFTCGILQESARGLRCWGLNSLGALGNNSTTNSFLPVKVNADSTTSSTLTGATQVVTGDTHGCALMADGTMKCWGNNTQGQLGDTTGTSRSYPSAVLNLGSGVTQIAAGALHTCALLAGNYGVQCWGYNNSGELAIGASGASHGSPVWALSGPNVGYGINGVGVTGAQIGYVRQIAAGAHFNCGVEDTGMVSCWGDNQTRQLGANLTVSGSAYVKHVVDAGNHPLTGAVQVTAGTGHACALLNDGTVACWGDNSMGQVGNGAVGGVSANWSRVLDSAGGNLKNVVSIASGVYASHTCAVLADSTMKCWGNNSNTGVVGATGGQLGANLDPTVVAATGFAVPVLADNSAAKPLLRNVQSVAIGRVHTCALMRTGGVKCWGQEDPAVGRLGDSATPVLAARLVPQDLAFDATNRPDDVGTSINSAWLLPDGTISGNVLSSANAGSFASATDGNGTAVAVFLMMAPSGPDATNPWGCSLNTAPITHHCEMRLYASVRGVLGNWSLPARIDTQFTQETTTFYQDSDASAQAALGISPAHVAGGIPYATPAIAYVGNGRFMAVFALADNGLQKSGVYARGYTVGTGWDPTTVTIEELSMLQGGSTAPPSESFRYANDLQLAADGQGDALLTLHYVLPSEHVFDATQRAYGFKVYRYNAASGWATPQLILGPKDPVTGAGTPCAPPTTDTPGASVLPSQCWNLKPSGAIFPSGEAVVLFPGQDPAVSTHLRLYSTEYHP